MNIRHRHKGKRDRFFRLLCNWVFNSGNFIYNQEIWISEDYIGASDGTRDRPFKTMVEALDHVNRPIKTIAEAVEALDHVNRY